MKKPIYKKWWFWIIIVIIIAVIGTAGGDSDKKDNQGNTDEISTETGTNDEDIDEKDTAAEENTDEKGTDTEESGIVVEEVEEGKTEAVTIEEQVLLEQDGIKITAKELTEDVIWGYAVAVLIENTSEQDVTVQVRNMSVNGIMTEPMFSCDVAAGKSANDTITLMDTSLEVAGITTIQNMEFSFHIFHTESWDTVLDSDVIYLATSADGTQEQVINNTGTVVLEQDGISITVQRLDTEESFWGADIYVYIENNSEQNITVQANSVSINGFMVEPMFSSDIVAGKKAFDSITFLESDLTDNGITSVDELEISFHIFNLESWDTILDSEPMKISFTE